MIPFTRTVGFRLFLISTCLLSVVILIDSFFLVHISYSSEIQERRSVLKESLIVRELPLSYVQPLKGSTLEMMALFLGMQNKLPDPSDALNQTLEKITKENNFSNVLIVRRNNESWELISSGHPVAQDLRLDNFLTKYDPFDRDAWSQGYSEFLKLEKKDKKADFVLAKGIVDLDGNPIGALVVIDDASKILDTLIQPTNSKMPIFFALSFSSGESLVATKNGYQTLLTPPEVRRREQGFWELDFGKMRYLAHSMQIPGTQFTLTAVAPKASIYTVPLISSLSLTSSYLVIMLIGSVIIFLISKRMTRGVQNLYSTMQGVQQGEIHKRYQPDIFGFQMNRLGCLFNQMMDLLLVTQSNTKKTRIEKELLAKELALAGHMQQSLLEIDPIATRDVELACGFIPARLVGGDFYSSKESESHELFITIADGSGKGVGACCYSLILKNLLLGLSKKEKTLGGVMRKANNLFCADTRESGMFVTAFSVKLDPSSGDLEYYSFGHNPAFICHSDGECRFLDQNDIAMGIMEKEERIDGHQEKLEKGEILVLYTDGVTEAHNEENTLLGMQRFIEMVQTHKNLTVQKMMDRILREIKAFVGEAPQSDDITLLLIKRKE